MKTLLDVGRRTICAAVAIASCLAAQAETQIQRTALVKEETVYAILAPSGESKSVIVSDWLMNGPKAATIADSSSLAGIKNVAGDEKAVASGQSLKWSAAGKDIYYQGTSSKAPPIRAEFHYYLDGKELKAQELAGKSGKVKVSLKLEDLDLHERIVDGRKKSLATPFAAVVVLILPSETFGDIELSPNARSISDGKNNVVMALLFPGLESDLVALGMKSLDLPDEFSFVASTPKFALSAILISATPGLSAAGDLSSLKTFGNFDAGELSDGLKSLSEKGDYIQKAIHALRGGSKQLKEGLDGAIGQLEPKLDEYKATIDGATAFLMSDEKIASARRLLEAAEALDRFDEENPGAFASAQSLLDDRNRVLLAKTMKDVQGLDMGGIAKMPLAGLIISDANIKSLGQALSDSDAFYRSLDEKRLQAASAFVDNARSYAQLSADLSAFCQSYDATKIEGLRALASTRAPDDVVALLSSDQRRAALSSKLATLPGLSDQERAALAYLVAAEPAVEAAKASSAYVLGQLDPALRKAADESRSSGAAMAASQAYLQGRPETSIKPFVSALMAQKEEHNKNRATYEIADAILKLSAKNGGIKKTIAQIEAVQSDLKGLEPVLSSLEAMASSPEISKLAQDPDLKDKLSSMMADLRSCRELLALAEFVVQEGNLADERKLVESAPELAKGLSAIREGTGKIADNLGKLDDGFTAYNEEGIQKLAIKLGSVADTLAGVQGSARQLIDLSSSYSNFSGIAAGMDGRVKFVMRTEDIEAK